MGLESHSKSLLAVPILAMLVLTSMFAVIVPDSSDAAGYDDYGAASNINIAPGYSWTYTPSYPSDISSHVTTTIQAQGTSYGTTGTWASINQSGLTSVTIPANAAVGTVYHLVLKASMTTPVSQTAYQHITFTVTAGLSVSGSIDNIIKGTAVDFTPSGTSSMGSVSWSVTSGKTLPAGLSLSGGKVIGTPTTVGVNTVYLTATASGESKDLTVTFTVYNVIVGGTSETIFSHGNTVSSKAIAQTGSDLGVTWSVTNGTIPAGFSLNASTGVVSGSSTVKQSTTITITGTSANGPLQTVTKQITIQSEPTLSLSGGSSMLTYKNNTSAVTSTVTANDVSAITWSLTTSNAGVTQNNGVVTAKNCTFAGAVTVTVKAVTAYGQIATKDITLTVEDTLSITGDEVLNAIAGTAKQTSAYTVTGGSGNILNATTTATGLNQQIVDGKLQINSSSIVNGKTVTVTATSLAGQTASIDTTVNVLSALVFTSVPETGVIAFAV